MALWVSRQNLRSLTREWNIVALLLAFWKATVEGLGTLRAAFKFGRRVHSALQRKMRKPPIARLPAIEMDLINRPSGETDCVYETKVK